MSGHLDLIAREGAVLLFVEPSKDPMLFAGQPAVEFVGLRQMAIAPAPGADRAGLALGAFHPAPGMIECRLLDLISRPGLVEEMTGPEAAFHTVVTGIAVAGEIDRQMAGAVEAAV